MRREFVPNPDDLLCEQCGYVLNGLPTDGNCPECGHTVAESTVDSPRRAPIWEQGTDRPAARFQATAIPLIFRKKSFFRTMTAHGDAARSARFALIALLPGLLIGTKAALMHAAILHLLYNFPTVGQLLGLLAAVPVGICLFWWVIYVLVIRLTALEARYWGMRLPREVVRRAVHYTAIHASVASLLPWAVTLTYLCLLIANDRLGEWATTYLYTLSLAVVASAVYLFYVYVTAMKSLMYANR